MLVKYIDGDKYRNIYTVGDIHGEYHKLISQLNRLEFDPRQDLLIGVGDLVDRGKNSLECAFLPDEPWFETVLGNHEEFCIKGFSDYRVEFYHKMTNNGGEWFYQQIDETKRAIVEVFKELPYMIELTYRGKKYGFVHADLPYEDWEHVKACLETNDLIGEYRTRDWVLWAREMVRMDKINVAQIDQVFIGHTYVEKVKDVGNVKFIDTGSVFTGGELAIIKL
jgi:serine/threonine protein phosphatase 1